MPSGKESSHKNTESPLDQLLDRAVADTAKSLRSRKAMEYDGVHGTLPDWIPDNLKNDFESARNRLLEHYDAEKIRAYMNSSIAAYLRALANPTNAQSQFPFVLPPRTLKDVSLLARIKTAVEMGKVKGIEYLLGANHARLVEKADGYSAHQSRIAKARRGKLPGGEGYIRDVIAKIEAGTPLECGLTGEGTRKSRYSSTEPMLPPDESYVGAKEVWCGLIGWLDKESYQVREEWNVNDIKKSRLIYDDGIQRPKSITFGRMENILWEIRKERREGIKKSR